MSEARRLKTLEEESAKLKRLLEDAMLENISLKDLREKSGGARYALGNGGASAVRLWHERVWCLQVAGRGS